MIGPFLIYCNSAPSHEDMWKNALAKAGQEALAWPYDWVAGVDYPLKNRRGTVTGQLVLKDSQAPDAQMQNLLVGLAAPDYPTRGSTLVDWQMDAKFYQFWGAAEIARADLPSPMFGPARIRFMRSRMGFWANTSKPA